VELWPDWAGVDRYVMRISTSLSGTGVMACDVCAGPHICAKSQRSSAWKRAGRSENIVAGEGGGPKYT
jgi:hypothetical protein